MALRIGVNALYLIPGGVGGTEIYLRNLLDALARTNSRNEYLVLTNRKTADLVPAAPNMRALPQPVAGRVRPARILWEQTAVPVIAARRRFDVLFNPGFTAPLLCPCPQVTVFHDLQHKRHPENFRWFDLPAWNVLLWGAARRSARLIAVSEATRKDLNRFYGVDARVVGHGVERELFDVAEHRAPEPFVLCVSTLHPHKGFESLLKGFAEFRAQSPEFRLVLAGMRGFAARAVEESIRGLGLAGGVDITGWISRQELVDLYRRAWAFVYPSLFEGFGMPVAEAMAAGVPVACSDIEPLREIAGDAALLFTPGDERGIALALSRITRDESLRARLVAAARRRATRFTWAEAACRTVAVLEEAASAGRARR
jgi:glycosyltransferase involved in cell wall biosynthesis